MKNRKAPWRIDEMSSPSENHRGYRIRNSQGYSIADVMPIDTDGIEGAANARLISAAPELLEALKLCAGVVAGETLHKEALIQALMKSRAAIAKAEGDA